MKLSTRVVKVADGTYRAHVPALPGCSASGETAAEALASLSEALRGYLAAATDCATDRLPELKADCSVPW